MKEAFLKCGDVTLAGLSELSYFSVSDKGTNNKMGKIRCCTSGLGGNVATVTGFLDIPSHYPPSLHGAWKHTPTPGPVRDPGPTWSQRCSSPGALQPRKSSRLA